MDRLRLLGVIQTVDGFPLDFEFFGGNMDEVYTLVPMSSEMRGTTRHYS